MKKENLLKFKIEKEADTAVWFTMYDNYDNYLNTEIKFSILKLNITIKNIETLRDNNIDDIDISHDKFNVTEQRKLSIVNSKLFKDIIKLELEKIELVENSINQIEFDDDDSMQETFNTFVSENF